jgi:site-specific recombinase XerD
VNGLRPEHWRNANPIRDVFKQAFERAGLHYAHPHLIRHSLGQLGERLCQTAEEFKSWSQNLGHDRVLTTFLNYGEVSSARQAEIMRTVGRPREVLTPEQRALAREIAELLSKVKAKP